MASLRYYAHRYRDKDPAVQAANLERAKLRHAVLAPQMRRRGIILWAPWIAMAEAGVDEETCWLVIDRCVRVCAGIVLDCDGADPSPGMLRESMIAKAVGGEVEVVR